MSEDDEKGYASQPERSAETSMIVANYNREPNTELLMDPNQRSWIDPSQGSSAATHAVGMVNFGTGPKTSDQGKNTREARKMRKRLQLLQTENFDFDVRAAEHSTDTLRISSSRTPHNHLADPSGGTGLKSVTHSSKPSIS